MRNGEVDLGFPSEEIRHAHAVAIIGLGPKGFCCLERLLAEFIVCPLDRPLYIHIFNRSATFGASPIYDPALPEYILVNISVGEIDLWTAEDPPAVGGRGPNFLSWYRERFQPQTPLTGDEYLSRAVVGHYLTEGFHRIHDHLPQGVTLSCHVGEVVDIRPHQTGYQLEFASNSSPTEYIFAEKIMLSTGHSQLVPGTEESQYHDFAIRHARARFIPFVYPVVETMRQIPAGANVAMKGIGLTFIDAFLQLTEGRGGCFQRTAQHGLVYHPCGKEPHSILPFSRTGLPMTPKACDLPQFARPLTFLNETVLAELRERASHRKLDLESDLWPFFESEMQLQYYRVTTEDGDLRRQLDSSGSDAEETRRVIDFYLHAHSDMERFDYRSVLDPVGRRSFGSGAEFSSFVEHYMEQEIERARRGQAGCGVKAAIDIWYEFRKVLNTFVEFGGLKPESHKKLIEYWFPRFKRVVFGPPIINIEKLLALCKAGILDFSVACNPVISMDESNGCFELRCDKSSGATASAENLVDARYPSVDLAQDAAPLYRNLYRRRMVRAYENRELAGDQGVYRPGAIDMTEDTRFVVDGNGGINDDIAVIGIPTEGNVVGNLTLERDDYASTWAAQVIEQLRRRARSSIGPATHSTTES
jgi:FAD-NAD(P)-binding